MIYNIFGICRSIPRGTIHPHPEGVRLSLPLDPINVITSGIIISPEEIPLISNKEYEIDTRPVVIQRARVLKWRPRFNEWRLKFTIDILDDKNISIPNLKEILEKAGATKGIGDYRPRFGRFMVTSFQEV